MMQSQLPLYRHCRPCYRIANVLRFWFCGIPAIPHKITKTRCETTDVRLLVICTKEENARFGGSPSKIKNFDSVHRSADSPSCVDRDKKFYENQIYEELSTMHISPPAGSIETLSNIDTT